MTYPFVAAENWSRGTVPIKAIAVHMAEGGGTVSWLTHVDGNSSHYVVEYSGRVVQMVVESRAAGSINPHSLRPDNDAPFTFEGESIVYGISNVKRVLGTYWTNPNAAVVAIEVEGFASAGPNLAQRRALKALIEDIRSRHGKLPCLGHRDFQNYKPCPGHRVAWVDFGGHAKVPATPAPAPAPQEEPMGLSVKLLGTTDTTPLDAFGTATVNGTGHSAIRVKDAARIPVADGLNLGVVQLGALTTPLDANAGDRTNVVVFNLAGELAVVLRTDASFTALPKPVDSTPVSQATLDAANAKAATLLTENSDLSRRLGVAKTKAQEIIAA